MKSTSAIILILVSIGLYYTFIGPEFSQVQDLRAEVDQYRQILSNVSDITAKRDQLETKLQAIPQTEIDRLNKVLPDSVESVKLARELDTIASKYAISLKTVQLSSGSNANLTTPQGLNPTTPNGPSAQNAKLDISFVATYDNFRKFLHDMEESIRVIDVDSLRFQAADNGLTQYDLSVETHWLN